MEDAGEILVSFDRDLVAIDVEASEVDFLRPDDGPMQTGHGEASLFELPLAPRLRDDRVHDRLWPFIVADVVDEQPPLHTDLRGRQTHARSLVHRLDHVLDEVREAAVDVLDLGRALPEHGVAEDTDGIRGHGFSVVRRTWKDSGVTRGSSKSMEDGEERPVEPVEHERGSDEQRFITLYAETADAIHRYTLRRLPLGSHDAPDLTAEIFAVAWRRISSVPDPPHDRLWLFGVARNVLAHHQRSVDRRQRLRLRLGAEPPPTGEADLDAASSVRHAIDRLPSLEREVLRLVMWDGLSHEEAAETLGCSVNAVGLRIHRAKQRLRAALETSDRPDPGPAAGPALARALIYPSTTDPR